MKRALYLAFALLLPLCGCRTYLGYDLENVEVLAQSEELVRTGPPSEIRIEVKERPTTQNRQMALEVQGYSTAEYKVSKEVKEKRNEKYMEWRLGGKLGEMLFLAPMMNFAGWLMGPMFALDGDVNSLGAWPPWDLVIKILGGHGMFGLEPGDPYAKHPPSYWTRVSQNSLTGLVNPFQRLVLFTGEQYSYSEAERREIVVEKEKRAAWNPLPNHALQISASRFNCPPIAARTDARGVARVDFSPWAAYLEPGKALEVVATSSAGKARIEERFLCSTDDLVSLPALAEAQAKPSQVETPPASPPSPPPEKPAEKPAAKPAEKPEAPDYARLQAVRRVALVIGIDQYAHYPALRSAVGDARGLAAVLRSSYGFAEVRELLDRQATRAGILEAVENLAVAAKKGDGVLLFFAGHGEYSEPLARGAWVPADAQSSADFIPNSAIHDFVKAMDARGAGHVLVIADACFSGAFLEVTRSADRGLGVRPAAAAGAELPRWLEKLAASPSRRALTSGSIEPVADSGGGGHSPFTRCLLEALRNPENDAFTATELAARVQRLVGLSSEQTPRYGVIRFAGDMAGRVRVCQEREIGPDGIMAQLEKPVHLTKHAVEKMTDRGVSLREIQEAIRLGRREATQRGLAQYPGEFQSLSAEENGREETG